MVGARRATLLVGVVVSVLAVCTAAMAARSAGPAAAAHRSGMPGMRMGGTGSSGSSMQHMEMPTAAAYVPDAVALTPHGWTVTATSSIPGHSASSVLGAAGASSYWQSAGLGRGSAALPQTLTVRFPAPTTVSALTYLPHGTRGVIGRFVVALSSDGRRFGRPVAYGRWQANLNLKRVAWVPQTVRAVRLTVLSLSSSRDRAVAISRLLLAGALRDQARTPRGRARAAQGASNASVVGQWGPTIGFPLVPVAVALIPGNRLVMWSADAELSFDGTNSAQYTQTAIYNLASGTVSAATVSNTAHNMFCPGVSILPDGEVIVTGGIGNTDTSIYNPATNSWRAGPQLNIGRGYQGQTTLPDGQVFVLGGSWSGGQGGKLGEIWSPHTGWRELTNIPATPIYTADAEGAYRADNHGWFIATSGGRIFQAGPSAQMHWITTAGAGSITNAGARGSAGDEMNGNAVLYDVNRILAVGGAPDYDNSNATSVANVIDIGGSSPVVSATSSMSVARAFANSVVLPDGQVFTVGGQTFAVPFSDQTSDLTPEMWTPGTGTWTQMAQEAEPRNYHSVAVLLPDGTVFSGGGGLCGSCATNHPDAQIFYPPYLFNADGSLRTRPTISSAPSSAQTGQTISVTTGGAVSSFVMIRYGEATHTVDNDQRRIPLSILSQSGNTYQLAIPSDPGIALPGPYMLFAIDGNGTPSVSATIDVTTPSTSTPASAYGRQIDGDGPALYWPLSDAAGSAAADMSGNGDLGSFSSGVTYQTPSPVEGTNGTGITLGGGDVVSTQPQAAPAASSEELWFKTRTTGGGALASDQGSGVADRMLYMTSSGQIAFAVRPGSTTEIQTSGAYNDGAWHFVVATQGGDGMHIYVDGRLAASAPATAAASFLGYWQVGGSAAGWPNQPSSSFSGSVSDAAFFVSELSASQVGNEFAAGLGGSAIPPPPPAQQTLSIALAGSGSGTVSGGGLACPGICSGSFAAGTQTTLTATAAAGSTFAGWSGACSGTGSCAVTLSQAAAVTATFVVTPASGSTTPQPQSQPQPPPADTFVALSQKVGGGGTLTLLLRAAAPGSFTAHATYVERVTVTTGRGKARHTRVTRRTVVYGTATGAADGAGTVSLKLAPTGRTLARLKAQHRLHVTIVVRFVPAAGSASQITERAVVSVPVHGRRHATLTSLTAGIPSLVGGLGNTRMWECNMPSISSRLA